VSRPVAPFRSGLKPVDQQAPPRCLTRQRVATTYSHFIRIGQRAESLGNPPDALVRILDLATPAPIGPLTWSLGGRRRPMGSHFAPIELLRAPTLLLPRLLIAAGVALTSL
jgi:hypothetical protein